MRISFKRLAGAILRAIAAFVIAAYASFFVLIWTARNDRDGQAGIGAMVGGFLLGCIAAIVTFIVSLRRSSDRSDFSK
jgi:hypothetical protein